MLLGEDHDSLLRMGLCVASAGPALLPRLRARALLPRGLGLDLLASEGRVPGNLAPLARALKESLSYWWQFYDGIAKEVG